MTKYEIAVVMQHFTIVLAAHEKKLDKYLENIRILEAEGNNDNDPEHSEANFRTWVKVHLKDKPGENILAVMLTYGYAVGSLNLFNNVNFDNLIDDVSKLLSEATSDPES